MLGPRTVHDKPIVAKGQHITHHLDRLTQLAIKRALLGYPIHVGQRNRLKAFGFSQFSIHGCVPFDKP